MKTKFATRLWKTLKRARDAKKFKKHKVTKLRLMLIFAVICYGTTYATIRALDDKGLPVGMNATLRFGIAAIILLPWLFSCKGPLFNSTDSIASADEEKGMITESDDDDIGHLPAPLPPIKCDDDDNEDNCISWVLLHGFIIGIINAAGFISQAIALKVVPVGKVAFVASLAMFLVPIYDKIAGYRVYPRHVAGMFIALGGVFIMEFAGGKYKGNSEYKNFEKEDLISLIQPVAFSFGFWRMENVVHRYPGHVNRITAAQVMAIFICLLVYTGIEEPESFDAELLRGWLSDSAIIGSLLFLGLLASVFTLRIELRALKIITATELTLVLAICPFFSAVTAKVILDEPLHATVYVGAVIVVVGNALSALGLSGLVTREASEVVEELDRRMSLDPDAVQAPITRSKLMEK